MKKILFLIGVMLLGSNAFAMDCDSASQCVIIGKKLIDQKEYSSAIDCFNSAISMDEDDEFAYAFRANAKYYLKDYEGALSDAEKSLTFRKTAVAYNSRANIKLINGDINGAIEDLTNAIELNPKYVQCYVARAKANNSIQNYVEALEDACKAIKLDKKYAESYEMKAEAEKGLKDYRSAERDYLIAIDMYKLDGDRKNANRVKKIAQKCKRKIKW